MDFRYVVAIVRPEVVGELEKKLVSLGIGGVSVSKVKGYGEYKNFFTSDWFSDHARIEVFVEAEKVAELLAALLELARGDIAGAGVAAVMPVEKFVHLRTGTEVLPTRAT
jgi:nitrogen regulatory protein P-II 1